MKFQQKLTKIGNSVGVILPKKLLTILNLSEGKTIYIEKFRNKIILEENPSASISPDFLKVAEDINKKYTEVFKKLANR